GHNPFAVPSNRWSNRARGKSPYHSILVVGTSPPPFRYCRRAQLSRVLHVLYLRTQAFPLRASDAACRTLSLSLACVRFPAYCVICITFRCELFHLNCHHVRRYPSPSGDRRFFRSRKTAPVARTPRSARRPRVFSSRAHGSCL